MSSQTPSEVERHAGTVWAVDVFLDSEDGTVHAEAKLHASGREALVATGDAGLCPGQDLAVGERLAASRALEQLAVGLIRDARQRVDGPGPEASEEPEGRIRTRRSMPRMLVGTDRPLGVTPALEWSVAHAEATGLGIELCHVVDDAGPAWERTLRGSVSDANDEMAELVEEVRQDHPDVYVTSSVLVGSESALLARSLGRELVVIGRADEECNGGSYVGATAITIAQNASVPVVVVPPGWSPPRTESPVVVAIDALEPHLEAVEFALAYAQGEGLPLIAVSAWQPQAPPGTRMVLDSGEEWMERVADGQDAAVTPLRALYQDVPVTQRTPTGPPVEVILGLAEDAALLVVGRPGHARHWRMPLGSVSRRLLHRATVPVAVVPSGWRTPAGDAAVRSAT
ncbi:universal stress protein [Nocardioides sp. NPDC087217]|uniref:universal stress protein n=1 Tax=Nocardioides sp. NPDC087217 TaxID=3364335 RepID=UPI0037FACF3B